MKEGSYIYLMGQECELRPISAMEFIAARTESASNMDKENISDETRELIVWANVLSRGIYSGGEKVFADSDAVLRNLTASEIAFAAQEYAYTLPKVKKGSSDEHMKNAVGSDESNIQPVSMEFDDLSEISQSRREMIAYSQDIQAESTADMQAVSDFFERDSRRYDGKIELY